MQWTIQSSLSLEEVGLVGPAPHQRAQAVAQVLRRKWVSKHV